jgi:hypothetical protein
MTELAVTAASAVLAFLVLYGAAVIFTLERIGDRFSPMLIPGFLARRVAIWFIGLALLVLAGLVVIPLEGQAKVVPALVLFIASLLVLVFASFATWRSGSHVGVMLAIARGIAHPEQAVREILWRAIDRADVAAVARSLRAFERSPTERADLLAWLLGHRALHDSADDRDIGGRARGWPR